MKPPHPAHEPNGSQTCARDECVRAGTECTYTDRNGIDCATFWCDDHGALLGGYRLCVRHHSTLEALGDDPDRAAHPPVENRAAGMVQWIARSLDSHVTALLHAVSDPNETLRADICAHLRADRNGAISWRRGWALVKPSGVSTVITLEVTEAEDSVVRLLVDGRLVHSGVPHWISWRRLALNSPASVVNASHKLFTAQVREAISDGVVAARRLARAG